ncbi:uncharacterized protein B0H18DRAFT_871709 [Fomitopsis serialis]|uniref:uncharacterized protein n=1 Tax=Fomitopsis serialis TaxID=139415 RepID=UPI002007D10A|nr:uncharacterized protein B0H18DRAFT_871709 [Neoantrodia serialis]KAH9931930.1 hypothetical protein B0H18DRAFT_871709 [Neoantrodia serialis]
MCYYLITYVHHACGHDRPTRRHYIDCNMSTCILSMRHKYEDHDCENTCTETMLPDQHIVMESTDDHCDPCSGIHPSAGAAIDIPALPILESVPETDTETQSGDGRHDS